MQKVTNRQGFLMTNQHNHNSGRFKSFLISSGSMIILALSSFFFSLSCFLSVAGEIGFRIALLWTLLFTIPIFIAGMLLITMIKKLEPMRLKKCEWPGINTREFILCWLVLISIWAITLLIYYPGCCSTDTHDILKMILRDDFTASHFRYTSWNNHHPIAYSGMMAVFIKSGQALGLSLSKCIAITAFAQIVILSFSVLYSCYVCGNLLKSRKAFALSFLFFLVNPLMARFSVTLWKDIPFTAMALLFLTMGIEFLCVNKWRSGIQWAGFIIVAALTALFRNGGVLVPTVFLICVAIVRTDVRKKSIGALAVMYVVVFSVYMISFNILKIERSHFSESVATPLQQLSRVVVDDGSLSDEEKGYLDKLLPLDQYHEKYRPSTVNGIKFADDFSDNYLEENKLQFLQTWVSVGKKNPRIYVLAWIDETKGFWDVGTETSYYVADPGYELNAEDGRIQRDLLPGVSVEAANSLLNIFIIGTRPLTNGAALGWTVVAFFSVSVILRRTEAVILSCPLIIHWGLFVINSPIVQQFRYISLLYVSLPLIGSVFLFNSTGDGRWQVHY